MVAARIGIGWVNKCFEGETASDIMSEVEEYQDFGCLLMMGRANEGKKGQKELDKLEAFLQKYYERSLTMSDLENLNIKLSIGNIVCYGIAEGEEAIAKLKAES